MLLKTIIDGNFEDIVETLGKAKESDQDFILAIRYLVETQNYHALELVFEQKNAAKMSDKKVVTLAAEGSLEIFKIFRSMYDERFTVEAHPLIAACAVQNTQIVKYIVSLIKKGKLATDEPHKLKDLAIKISARKGNVVILKLLCKTQVHIHNAIATMLTNGNHAKVPRLLDHPALDFSVNDFELLKLCSPYIVELMEISRHKSVYSKYDDLPADYYRHVVDASKAKFEKNHGLMKRKHISKVRRTSEMILTGAVAGGQPIRQGNAAKKIQLLFKKKFQTNPPADEYVDGVEPVNNVGEFNKRTNKSVKTGAPVKFVTTDNLDKEPIGKFAKREVKSATTGALSKIENTFRTSACTADDIQAMITGVHLYHKKDFEREMHDKKLHKFEIY